MEERNPVFSLRQQIACVQREIRLRRQGRGRRGRMSVSQAAYDAACMQAVLDTLRTLERQGLCLQETTP